MYLVRKMRAYATGEWKLTNPKEIASKQEGSKTLLQLVIRATEKLMEINF